MMSNSDEMNSLEEDVRNALNNTKQEETRSKTNQHMHSIQKKSNCIPPQSIPKNFIGDSSSKMVQGMTSDKDKRNSKDWKDAINVDSNLPNKEDFINILLFGETGVGKSTVINAFANYLYYPNLETAMENELKILIPSKFTITDENYQKRTIEIGDPDKNECTDVGASATQCCKSYVFPPIEEGKSRIRFIDTPGIADTRGIQKDNINFDNILSYISDMKQLNAICVLLRPNAPKLTVEFEYCIKQLLCRLDRSAIKNLVFVFTNTRGTFYRPGETLSCITKLFEEIPNVTIPLSKNNMFCMDNESFRFLAAYSKGIKFEAEDTENFSKSWIKTSAEVWRMVHYITGGGSNNNAALEPHIIENSISINRSRSLIIQLSKPMVDITEHIGNNISSLEKHLSSLSMNYDDVSKLKEKLFIPFTNLIVTELKEPATVCTAIRCSQPYPVNGVEKWHYKQRCHDPCGLSNVPHEIIGSPKLMKCSAMNAKNNCNVCNCSYQVHMHVYYFTKTVEDKIINAAVYNQFTSKKMVIKAAEDLVAKTNLRIKEFQDEKRTILKTTAEFAHFLQKNAITVYNDAYKSYLLYLIDRENSRGDEENHKTIRELEEMLKEYEEQKLILKNALKRSNSTDGISAQEIVNRINDLYKLKHTGKKIKEMLDAQNYTRQVEIRSNTNECIVYCVIV